MNKLKFTPLKDNAKLEGLGKKAWGFSLPAGYSCPGARSCLSKAVQKDGKFKLIDGQYQEFRCFAAVQEVRFSNVRKNRWHNFKLLNECKSISQMVDLIQRSLPINSEIFRWHISGDFLMKII